MMYLYFFIGLSLQLVLTSAFGNSYNVTITSDSPIVRGGTIHFVATVYSNGTLATGNFAYIWKVNTIKPCTVRHESFSPIDRWNVTFPATDDYPPGPYTVEVSVKKKYFFWFLVTSQRAIFELTELLNGQLDLIQNNKVVTTSFIANNVPSTFSVNLKTTDALYLNSTATSVLVYWFIDCIYYGVTTNFTHTQKFTEVNKDHIVEALVIADFEPITTLAPSTTTTAAPPITTLSPNSTTKAPNVTTTMTTPKITTASNIYLKNTPLNAGHITSAVFNNSTTTSLLRQKRSIKIGSSSMTPLVPYVCSGNHSIAPDVNKTYGYFKTKFSVKAPVSNLSVTGNYWLPKGELLILNVKCLGSPSFSYCMHFFDGVYNVTGNETCDVPPPDTSDECQFPIQRYFTKAEKHTVVIVIYNEVNKIVSPVTVTLYEVQKQAQLSVIVVPVSFCLVAVVLVVFGVAYYAQNRSRYTIEVADFDFGQQGNELEYKTFKERLYDSIANAFMRAPTPGSSESTVWPPGQKYGSLT